MTSSSRKTTAPAKTSGKAASGTKSTTKSARSKIPSPADVPPKTTASATQPLPRTQKIKADAAPKSLAMKKQELVEKVVRQSGIKKKDAKPVVEAMLDVLGEALADGRELNLQPMGKLKLNRTKETPNARVIVCKIRQSKRTEKASVPVRQTVAAAAE